MLPTLLNPQGALRALVLFTLLAAASLAALLHWPMAPRAWVDLLRYLPYPAWLLPTLLVWLVAWAAGWLEVDFAGSGVTFTYTGGADWMNYGNPKFNGLRIHDAAGVLPKILGVTVTSPGIGANSPVVGARGFLLEGFNPTRDLQFDDDSIYVNLANGMWHEEVMGSMGCPRCDTIAFSVAFESAVPPPPVPEPSTYALMVTGLGVAAWGARRRRPRTTA